jgi:hypothetical protein
MMEKLKKRRIGKKKYPFLLLDEILNLAWFSHRQALNSNGELQIFDMEEVKGLIQQLTTRMDRWDTERGRNY